MSLSSCCFGDILFVGAHNESVGRDQLAHSLHNFIFGCGRRVYSFGNQRFTSRKSLLFDPIVGSVGLSRPRELRHPVSAFLAIGTGDDAGRPARSMWNSMPIIAKQSWYGQLSLPTLDEDVDAWAHLNHCGARGVTQNSWGQEIH